MLPDVRRESTARVSEARLVLNDLATVESVRPRPVSPGHRSLKGLYFVQLYAILEFTVYKTVQRTLQLISADGPPIRNLKPVVLSMALDAQCRSLADVGPTRMWQKRREVFTTAAEASPTSMNDALFPADGANLKYDQLASVWETFAIAGPVLPEAPMRGRLSEITDHRNAIAHGRESPAAIGGRYSVADLEIRCNEVSALCEHVMQSFENYLVARAYLA